MSEEIDRWVSYMKNHPDTWKRKHTAFIDAQFAKHQGFLRRVQALPDGAERLVRIYGIMNTSGYPFLLKKGGVGPR